MMICDPRNPGLYQALLDEFGSVNINNAGMPYYYNTTRRPDGGVAIYKLSGGEEYCVCCPECGDTRHRLNVNHMFGERLEDGRLLDNAAHCWNEDCEVCKKLMDLVEGYDFTAAPAVRRDGGLQLSDIARESRDAHMKLRDLSRVDELVSEAPAVKYLIERGFDPDFMGRRYGIHYCGDGKGDHRCARRRLIIPVVYEVDDRLDIIGWQARSLPGHTKTKVPKYFTSPGYRKSFFLFDYLEARKHDFVVLVEGPFDAMRIGAPAVAILGSLLSQWQARLIFDTWEGKPGPIVLIGDPEAKEEWEKNRALLDGIFGRGGDEGRIVSIPLSSTDPGASDAGSLWESIEYECKQADRPVRRPG